MSASVRDLEHAAQVQFVRAQKAEQKAEDIQHALNLVLNLGFQKFHIAQTCDGSVHEFELGTVRSLPAQDGINWPVAPKRTRTRRIILWRTRFRQGHVYATAFHESEFRSLSNYVEADSEFRVVLGEAIERVPGDKPFLVR
jgi:hypothetical protein